MSIKGFGDVLDISNGNDIDQFYMRGRNNDLNSH